jgi:hypothetical protein
MHGAAIKGALNDFRLNLIGSWTWERSSVSAGRNWDLAPEILEKWVTSRAVNKLRFEIYLGDAKVLKFKVVWFWVEGVSQE